MNTPIDVLAERLDRLLPQTQCRQCGYDGCRPYAEAMARGDAATDHCPPGGDPGARALARVLGTPPRPYDRSRGLHQPAPAALIVEADCIGCTKCIQACPVDAIMGGAKHMHTVLQPLCTGCGLCVPACPVDCIVLVATGAADQPAAAGRARGIQRAGDAAAASHAEQIRSTS